MMSRPVNHAACDTGSVDTADRELPKGKGATGAWHAMVAAMQRYTPRHAALPVVLALGAGLFSGGYANGALPGQADDARIIVLPRILGGPDHVRPAETLHGLLTPPQTPARKAVDPETGILVAEDKKTQPLKKWWEEFEDEFRKDQKKRDEEANKKKKKKKTEKKERQGSSGGY